MTQEEHELRAALEELGRDLDRMTDEGERSNRTSSLRRSVHASPSRPRGLTREMIDLTGERFGRLKVIGYLGRNRHRAGRWLCRCQCGGRTVASSSNLRCGCTASCGCLKHDLLAARNRARAHHPSLPSRRSASATYAVVPSSPAPSRKSFVRTLRL